MDRKYTLTHYDNTCLSSLYKTGKTLKGICTFVYQHHSQVERKTALKIIKKCLANQVSGMFVYVKMCRWVEHITDKHKYFVSELLNKEN